MRKQKAVPSTYLLLNDVHMGVVIEVAHTHHKERALTGMEQVHALVLYFVSMSFTPSTY